MQTLAGEIMNFLFIGMEKGQKEVDKCWNSRKIVEYGEKVKICWKGRKVLYKSQCNKNLQKSNFKMWQSWKAEKVSKSQKMVSKDTNFFGAKTVHPIFVFDLLKNLFY